MHLATYTGKNRMAIAGVVFAAISLLVFSNYCMAGVLPGNCDTWGNLAIFKYLSNNLPVFFHISDSPIVRPLYPDNQFMQRFGIDIYTGLIFQVFSLIGAGDILAYNLTVITIFTLNALAMYVVLTYMGFSMAGSFLGAFSLAFSNFMFCNIDNVNAIAVFPGLISVGLLLKSLEKRSYLLILLSGVAMGLQLYFAAYQTFILGIFWLAVAAYSIQQHKNFVGAISYLCVCAAAFFVTILPVMYIYLKAGSVSKDFNPVLAFRGGEFFGLKLMDLIFFAKGNLLHGTSNRYMNEWFDTTMSVGVGWLSWLFIVVMLFTKNKLRLFMAVMLVTGVTIAIGSVNINIGAVEFPSPFKLLSTYVFKLDNFIRVPIRFVFIITIAAAVGCAYSIDKLKGKIADSGWKNGLLFTVILGLLALENIPVNTLQGSAGETNCADAYGCLETYKTVKSNGIPILHLPSKLFNSTDDRRENIYMYHSQQNGYSCLNGNVAYFPADRLNMDTVVNSPSPAFEKLNQGNFFVLILHKHFAISNAQSDACSTWAQIKGVQPLLDDNRHLIFAVNGYNP